LTLLGLTAVLANKIKGFVPEKNRFREAVKNPAFLLNCAHVDAVSRNPESKGGIYSTTKRKSANT